MPGKSPGSKDIVINGRFLAQKLSGVQRYSREIVTALDRLIAADPGGLGARRWRLLVPADATVDLDLTRIAVERVGHRSGHVWEQWDLPRAARNARLVNLGNSGPVLHRDALVVIHDVAVFRTPKNFAPRYARFHRILGRILARTARLGTVSRFSRAELADVFGLPREAIFVATNGSDHLRGRVQDDAILDRLGVVPGRYFLFVGSPTPNKNLATALDAFARLDRADVRFVIAGNLDNAVFGGRHPVDLPGVIAVSGANDAEIAALYADAAALVFPSVYEGFGIPPLEAMAVGCPVIAADIPVLRETCGDAVNFFGARDSAGLARLMAAHLDDRPAVLRPAELAAARVAHYTWERGARALADAIVAS